jgi:peptide/nickel transport system permease protein
MTQGVQTAPVAPAAPAAKSELSLAARFFDSDVWASFKRSKTTMVAAFVTAVFFAAALFAGWISPQDPFDPGQLELMNSRLPPIWERTGQMPSSSARTNRAATSSRPSSTACASRSSSGFMGVAFSARSASASGSSPAIRRDHRRRHHARRRRAAHLSRPSSSRFSSTAS